MTKFIFKSKSSDLQKMFAIQETIQKNVLYLTYQVDWIRKSMNQQEVDKGLQKQVDDYFEDTEHPEVEDGDSSNNTDRN